MDERRERSLTMDIPLLVNMVSDVHGKVGRPQMLKSLVVVKEKG